MKIVSLFSNVGFGLHDIKDQVVLANELLPERASLHEKLAPKIPVICGDITKESVKSEIVNRSLSLGPIDGIVATPPCQGMSKANATKNPDDIRNKLIVHLMDVFNRIQPEWMLVENVSGIANTCINVDGEVVNVIDFIKDQLPAGYHYSGKVVDAAHYGTPQVRVRYIGLIHNSAPWEHPVVDSEVITCMEAIGNESEFPSLESGEASPIPWHYARNHIAAHIKAFRHTPTGKSALCNPPAYRPKKSCGTTCGGFKSSYKRNNWDTPAYTVLTNNGAPSGSNNVHPGRELDDGTYSDARVFTVRELLCLCGLPVDLLDGFAHEQPDGSFNYDLKENDVREVIGEIFPPKLCLAMIRNLPSAPSEGADGEGSNESEEKSGAKICLTRIPECERLGSY